MGTNWPEHLNYSDEDLLKANFNDVQRRKGVGIDAIRHRYEGLRVLANEGASLKKEPETVFVICIEDGIYKDFLAVAKTRAAAEEYRARYIRTFDLGFASLIIYEETLHK